MDITVETLLQAKVDLARRACEPQKYFKATALIAVADMLREVYDYTVTIKETSAGWLLRNYGYAKYGLLLQDSWDITHTNNEPCPDLLKILPTEIGDWLADWEQRISSWATAEEHLFETDRSWEIANNFLDVWYANIIRVSLPNGRGCANWLKKLDVIPTNTNTTFDEHFQHTVLVT